MEPGHFAETALQLLFKKLHPHLEDADHARKTGVAPKVLAQMHAKLLRSRQEVVEVLEEAAEKAEDATLSEVLDTLAANLTPLGENYQQSLIVTQLCLEEAPADLLPWATEGCVSQSSWGKRMVAFLARLEDPAFQARERWSTVDPDIGDDIGE
jgi:hypothetical protein